jgi:SAM-dependent methyltransferase
MVSKMTEAGAFLEAFDRYRSRFEQAKTIVELGAGQGWASCLAKALLEGEKHVVATDVSLEAVQSVSTWERVFQTKLDDTKACPSFELDFADVSVDLIFCFQSAHHFGAHRRTLTEVRRVLRPGGACLYLHEPTTPSYLYGRAVKRVNRKRASMSHDVVEDVIVTDRLLTIAAELGLRSTLRYSPTLTGRGEKQFLYFTVVGRLGRLQRFVPSTADFCFEKS